MKKLVFLITYFPWPPNTGTRIRNWQMLCFLAKRWDVHLLVVTTEEGAPVKGEWEIKLADLKIFNTRSYYSNKFMRIKASIARLLKGRPCSHYTELRKRISSEVRRIAPDVLISIGTVSAQFVELDNKIPEALYSFDEAGTDHLRIRTLLELDKNVIRRFRHYVDFLRMRRYERQIAEMADILLSVSPYEVQYLQQLAVDTKVALVPCGANLNLFQFNYAGDENHTLMFCGDLHYGPNEDAVIYFLEQIFPTILARFPDVRFKVVGRYRESRLSAVAARFPRVELVGYVEELNTQWRQASIFVNPMRQGRGFSTKILDAFTAGLAVVSTDFLIGGLGIVPGRHFLSAANASEFAGAVGLLLENPKRKRELAEAGRAYAEAHDWETSLRPLQEVLLAGGGEER